MKGEFPHTVRWVGSIEETMIRTGKSATPQSSTVTVMDVGEEPFFWALNNVGAKRFEFGGSEFIGGPRGEMALTFSFERQEDAALFKLFWC